MNALALFPAVAKRRDTAFTLVLPKRAATARPLRRRLLCRWRKDPRTGRLVCAWSDEGVEGSRILRQDGFRLAA
jgi:hypothetical protein